MKLTNRKALTLVEVVVSVTIFVMVLAGVLAVFVSGNRLSVSSRYRLEAVNLARSLLERLKAEVRQDTWDAGNLRIRGYADDPYGNLNNLIRVGAGNYYVSAIDPSVHYKVEYQVLDTGAAYRRVDVRVTITPAG